MTTHHGRIINSIPKSLTAGFVFSGIVSPIVQVSTICLLAYVCRFRWNWPLQAFFATRIAKCFDKPYLAILCWTLIFFRLLSSLFLAVVSFTTKKVTLFEARWKWVVTAGLIDEACVDLLTALSLCYFLMKSRRHSVHKRWAVFEISDQHLSFRVSIWRTIRLLDKLIAMTIREYPSARLAWDTYSITTQQPVSSQVSWQFPMSSVWAHTFHIDQHMNSFLSSWWCQIIVRDIGIMRIPHPNLFFSRVDDLDDMSSQAWINTITSISEMNYWRA